MTRPDQTVSQASEQKAPDSIVEFLSTYFADNFYISPSQSNEMVLKSLELDRERTPSAEDLIAGLVSKTFIRVTNAIILERAEEGIASPVLLRVMLLMTDEKEAEIEDPAGVDSEKSIDFESAFNAVKNYHLNFSNFFIKEIQQELKELTLEGKNIFEIDPHQFLSHSSNLHQLADKKIKEVLEKLGIEDEDFSILNLLESKKDEKTGAAIYSWKPKEEIAQFFANKLMAKYPALKQYQPEQERLESVLQYLDCGAFRSAIIGFAGISDIVRLLQSKNIDENLIGLQLLRISEQPFEDDNKGLAIKVFCHMFLVQSQTCRTVQDFLEQVNGFLEALKQKFPNQKPIQDACEYLQANFEPNLKLILHFAALMGNLSLVDDIVGYHISLGQRFSENVLSFAIDYGQKRLVEDFLKKCTPEEKRKIFGSKNEKSILEKCFEIGDLELIKIILAHCEENIKNNLLCNILEKPFHVANLHYVRYILDICGNENDMLDLLLSPGNKGTAFDLIINSGNLSLIELIINHYEQNERLRYYFEWHADDLLSIALKKEDLKLIEFTLSICSSDEKKAEIVSKNKDDLLSLALKTNNRKLLQVVLNNFSNDKEKREFVSSNSKRLLNFADSEKDIELIKLILDSFDDDKIRREFISGNFSVIFPTANHHNDLQLAKLIFNSFGSEEEKAQFVDSEIISFVRIANYHCDLEFATLVLRGFNQELNPSKKEVTDEFFLYFSDNLFKYASENPTQSIVSEFLAIALKIVSEDEKMKFISCDGQTLVAIAIIWSNEELLKVVLDSTSNEDKIKILLSQSQFTSLYPTIIQYLFANPYSLVDSVVDHIVVNDQNRLQILNGLNLNQELLKNLIDQEKFKAIGFLYKVGVKIPGLEKNQECRRSVIQTMIEGLAGLEVADQEFCLGKIFELAKNQDLKVDTIRQSLNTYASSESTQERLQQIVNDKIKPSTSLIRRALDGLQSGRSGRSRVVDSAQNPDLEGRS
ncbi:MAG: hypothetical protein V4612_06840 [Pseudomonadota bacterium]